MCSIVASKARVPFVASSSTAFTVFSRDVTLVTITYSTKHMAANQSDGKKKLSLITVKYVTNNPNSFFVEYSILTGRSHHSKVCYFCCQGRRSDPAHLWAPGVHVLSYQSVERSLVNVACYVCPVSIRSCVPGCKISL